MRAGYEKKSFEKQQQIHTSSGKMRRKKTDKYSTAMDLYLLTYFFVIQMHSDVTFTNVNIFY